MPPLMPRHQLSGITLGKLTQAQAAEILGVSTRTMRRWEDRYGAESAEGLYEFVP